MYLIKNSKLSITVHAIIVRAIIVHAIISNKLSIINNKLSTISSKLNTICNKFGIINGKLSILTNLYESNLTFAGGRFCQSLRTKDCGRACSWCVQPG